LPLVLRVKISDEASRFLRRLPARFALQIDARIQRLTIEPFPPGSLKLKGTVDVYRVRQGTYRILYRVRPGEGVLFIDAIGDRKDVYR
jgi:mRNA interferase RelE/StbE